jgi:hypothetical protein
MADALPPMDTPQQIAEARAKRYEEGRRDYQARLDRAQQSYIDALYGRVVAYTIEHKDDDCAIVYHSRPDDSKDNRVWEKVTARLKAEGYSPVNSVYGETRKIRLFSKDGHYCGLY